MARIDADWLKSGPTQAVFDLLRNYEVYAVGGCVRNTLWKAPVEDIDLSTSARPEVVMGLAEKAGLRVLPTGIEHGTVTVLIEGIAFEITTFRRDVETDGRRAVIAFSDDIDEDAQRRDFTVNAIYADRDGAIKDPVDGLSDIKQRRIRFIENAGSRIKEDYLRTLRFYRFNAYYADQADGFESDTLSAIAQNLDGLRSLSAERVTSELSKLLFAKNPAASLASMRTTGVLNIVLPGADDRAIGPLVELEKTFDVQPNGNRRFAAMGGEHQALRLSRKDAAEIHQIRANVGTPAHILGYKLGKDTALDAILVGAALMGQPLNGDVISQIDVGANAVFPIKAADLSPDFSGKALGEKLKALEARWVESKFTLSRQALLSGG